MLLMFPDSKRFVETFKLNLNFEEFFAKKILLLLLFVQNTRLF